MKGRILSILELCVELDTKLTFLTELSILADGKDQEEVMRICEEIRSDLLGENNGGYIL